jgi:IS30 family transposase
MHTKVYQRISNREREEISRSLATGKLISIISKELGRHRTTIYREIKRNSGRTGYRAFSASRRAEAAAGSRRRDKLKCR